MARVGQPVAKVKDEGCSKSSCKCNCAVISSTSSETTVDKAVESVAGSGAEPRFGPIVNMAYNDGSHNKDESNNNNKKISMDA